MIWHNEIWELKDTPPNFIINLLGIYNEPGSMKPAIVIKTIVQPDNQADTSIDIILYTHDPAHRESPTSDEILHKYQRQLLKLKTNITSYFKLLDILK